MLPLQLSAKQQSFLANLCCVVRTARYADNIGEPMSDEWISTAVLMECDRFGMSPQDIDAMYDKLHRTGANS